MNTLINLLVRAFLWVGCILILLITSHCSDQILTLSCVQGETKRCLCQASLTGIQHCDVRQEWGSCRCPPDSNGKRSSKEQLPDKPLAPCQQAPQWRQPCVSGYGSCQTRGEWVCTTDKQHLACSVLPDLSKRQAYDRCDNNMDDNCDGKINDACNWAFSFLGTSWGSDITIGPFGNIYVAGWFSSMIKLQGKRYNPGFIQQKGYILKLTPSGKVIWFVIFNGTKCAHANALALSPSGDVYMAGHFQGKMTLGTITLNPKTEESLFVAKLSSKGQWQWAVSVEVDKTTCLSDRSIDIAVSKDNNIAITGDYLRSITLGTFHLKSRHHPNARVFRDIYVAKLNPKGRFVWATSIGGTDYNYAGALRWGASKSLYITGGVSKQANFGNIKTSPTGELSAFVARLNRQNRWDWIRIAQAKKKKLAPATPWITGKAIAVDQYENVYITGSWTSETKGSFGSIIVPSNSHLDKVFVAKLTSKGRVLWVTLDKGTSASQGNGIEVNNSGEIYVTGQFVQGDLFFGTHRTYTKGRNGNIFVLKLTPEGQERWILSVGALNKFVGNSGKKLAIQDNVSIYITGIFQGSNVSFGKTKLDYLGTYDAFVWKITQPSNKR